MTFGDVIERLERGLREPLPGAAAQSLMAPQPRLTWPAGIDPARVRRAAALLLVFPIAGRPHIVLTLRAHRLDRHGGQVSLPGGVIDPDETDREAALREAHEEIGLVLESVRTLGGLTPLDIPISGFRLHPVVGTTDREPELTPSDDEVARILTPSLGELMKPDRIGWRATTRDGVVVQFPAFLTNDVEIWGATAMVLAEFLAMLGWAGPRPPGPDRS